MPRTNDDERAAFERALRTIAREGPLPAEELDSLSVLEGADLETFAEAFRGLPAAARARLVRRLHGSALDRLRLDYAGVNRLALQDEDEDVRLAGVQCAIEDDSPVLFDRLVELAASDPSLPVREGAIEDLARFSLLGELDALPSERVQRLRRTLLDRLRDTSEDPRLRSAALAALGYFSDQVVMDEVAAAFGDPLLRLGAIRAMGRGADPRWTDRLMPVLGSENPRLREEAALALGEIEDERAAGPLGNIVDDPDQAVRLAVIKALAGIGGDEAREALFYLVNDPDETISQAAEKALGDLDEEEDDPLSS